MQLLIDADQNHKTGWQGYDFCVNFTPSGAKECGVARWQNGKWALFATARLAVSKDQLHISVPRAVIRQSGRVAFDFHWVDNAPIDGDIKDF